MNKRILKNGLTGLLCIVLLLTNILSVGMEVIATELDSTILDAVDNLNDDNNEDTEEIIENDGQEEDSNLEESDDSGFQNDDNNQENSDSENENRDEEIENKENEEIDNLEEESEEIESDKDETLDEDDEILEESEELKEEAEIATVAVDEETLSEISGQCGDNLTWVLEDGTLTISGTGDMWRYGNGLGNPPWSEYAKEMQLRLVIQDGVTYIGSDAFRNCDFVGNLVIPDSVTGIGTNAFLDCSGFTGDLILSNNVTNIGNSAFSGCNGFLGSLIIPDSVTSIGNYAFKDCNGFTGSLVIPDSVTSIGNSAFSDCSGFTGSLSIPTSVRSMGDAVFRNCSGFSNLELLSDISYINEGTFEGCSGFTGSLVIPDSVTRIGRSAFSGCKGFTGSLVIPNNIVSIGAQAFYGCSGFTGSLEISDSITSIENGVFAECRGFTGELKIPDGVISIGEIAFLNCSGFTGKLTIPAGVTSIGHRSFYGCNSFTEELIIPNSVINIGQYAFYGCSGFTGSLIIPDSVINIGDYAFSDCSGFTGNLVISDSVTNIASNVFNGCSGFIGDLIIPSNITSIGSNAFSGCSGFKGNLIIPSSVVNVGGNAFSNCTGLNDVIFEGNSPSVEIEAFNGITAKAYYPSWKSGWDSVADNDYGGSLTWIPYSEGTSPWENGSTEGTTNFWFVVNTDAPDLDYDDVTGYNKKQFNLNISLTHLGMETDPESYEDVNLAIELPEGLSFSQNEEVKTLTDSLGTIDKTNNKQDVSHLVYITGNNKVDKFTVTVKVTAKDYVTPQVHTYDIGINTGETDPNATYFAGTLEAVDILGFNVTIDGKVYYVTDSFNMRIPMEILQNDDKRVICTVSGEKISKMETIENAAELEIILLGGKGDIIYQNGGYTSNSKTIQIVLHFNIKDKYKGLNIEQFKDIALNVDVIKLSLSDAGLNFGTKGWINQTGIREVEEKPDKQIGLGETQTYEFEVFVEEGFEPPINAKPEFNLTIAVTADGVEQIQNEKIHMMNLDYQRQKAEAQKEKRESQSNISRAKSELQKLCNGNYLTLGVDLQYYLSNTQMEYIEKYLYCWIAQVNNSQTYENRLAELENNLKKEINNKIMQKLGINPNVGFFWSQTEASTQVKVQTVYGEKTIEFTLHCGSLNSNGNTYASFGDIKYEILEKDNIPKNIPTEGLLGMTTYVGMNTFIQCMQDVAEDSIKKVYSELWGNNANIVAGMIVDETIMSIIDEKYGSFSNGVYTLFTKPSKNFVKKMRVDCPVDVYVYDLEGNLCGTIIDNKVDESYTDILMYVDDDSKIFYLTGDDYSLKLVGNDTGTMDYTVEEMDENMDILRTVQFMGLPLSEGKEYKGFIYEPILIDSTLYSLTTDEGIIKPDRDTYDGNVNDRVFTEGIVIDTVEKTIKVSEKLKLNAYVMPENATNKKIIWTSSDEQIATVNSDGLVIGIGKGNAIISAIADDGKFEAKYNLVVDGDSIGYTITASAEEGGSITPNGSIHVNEGENQTFTITPDSGYRLKSIVVDGKEEVPDEEKARESSTQQEGIRHYTFSDVRVNHIIRVVFEADNGNTGDSGNTGGNTGGSGNTGDNTGGNGNSGNTGGNTGDGGNSGNTGGSTGNSGSGENTGGNGNSSGNNGNTNSSGSNAGDNGSADSNSNNANGSGNTNATDNANNSHFPNSGAGNTMNTDNGAGNSNGNNKSNGVSNATSGSNGINPKTDSSKDTEPRTEDVSHIEIYATIAMIMGLLYLVLYFADEGGITEDEKNEIVAALVKWAKQGSWVRKYAALVLIFFLLAYYHSIGKRTSVEWKTVYEK